MSQERDQRLCHIYINHHALNKLGRIFIRHENILLINDVILIFGYGQ